MKTVESKILVIPEKGCTEKIGNFEIQADSRDYEIGKVVSVGEKVSEVKEGDTVYFYSGAGHKFIESGKEYRVIAISEVLIVK